MYIITQYAKILKRRTRILTKKYRLYAAFSVFLLLQLSNFRSCGACAVDGGHEYLRRSAKSFDDIIELSEIITVNSSN